MKFDPTAALDSQRNFKAHTSGLALNAWLEKYAYKVKQGDRIHIMHDVYHYVYEAKQAKPEIFWDLSLIK